jgi:hypothetical protein
MLCQLYYWSDKGSLDGGWTYHTRDELKEQTGLSHEEQRTALQVLSGLGLVETQYKRLEHKMLYRVTIEDAVICESGIKKPNVSPEVGQAELGNSAKPTSKTESTSTEAVFTDREPDKSVQGSASTDGEATPFTLSADPGLPVSSQGERCDSTGVPNTLAPSLASRIDSMTSPTPPPTLPKKVSRKAKQPKPPRPDFSAEFYGRVSGAWKDKAGGWPNMGRMRVEFRRLYDCGWTEAEVEAGWTKYLAETELSFLSTGAFSSRPAKWCVKEGSVCTEGPPRGYSEDEFDRATGRGKYANMGGAM